MKTLQTTLWSLSALLWLTLQVYAQSASNDQSPHNSGFITVNNVKIHYLDWGGAGGTLLFLHGMGDTAHRYDDFAPRFTNQFRVLAARLVLELGRERRWHDR